MKYYVIEKGDVFLCIKDFVMDDGDIAYKSGKTYKSEKHNCITDESRHYNHVMSDIPDFFDYFTIYHPALRKQKSTYIQEYADAQINSLIDQLEELKKKIRELEAAQG